jgi:hypothetical protein
LEPVAELAIFSVAFISFFVSIWIVETQSRYRKRLAAALGKELGLMVRGSLVEIRGRCGKPTCACAHDRTRGHLRHYLSFAEGGRTRMVYLRKEEVGRVRRGIGAWRRFRTLSKEVAMSNLGELLRREQR